jgi:hypothetical protein
MRTPNEVTPADGERRLLIAFAELDLKAAENLKLVLLTAVTTALTLPGLGTPVRMKYCACQHRFLG